MRISDWSSDVCSSDLGASSLAAGHKTLIPELVRLLKDAGRGDIKVVAGGVILAQDYEFLREKGVQGIYGPGSNVIECAADVLRLLGHNMPPVGLGDAARSEEHTSELQSLMSISYAVFCLKKQTEMKYRQEGTRSSNIKIK